MPYDKKFYDSFLETEEDKSKITLEKIKRNKLDNEYIIKKKFLDDALIRLQDVISVSENEKSFDLVIYSGGIYSFKEFKKMTSLVKEEMKQRKFKVKYVRPGLDMPTFGWKIYSVCFAYIWVVKKRYQNELFFRLYK